MNIQIKKIITLLLILPVYIVISINNTGAFLDSDLWINMYKDIDSWLIDFEEKQFVYELSGQDKNNISENLNKILKQKDIWECLENWINEYIVSDIVNWDISSVLKNLKPECYNKEDNTYNSDSVSLLINEILKIRDNYKTSSENKAKAIYEISKIWMYSDWNNQNSSFDIIKDIQDIDKIIFSEDIIYEWEETEFLSKNKKSPFISPLLNTIDDIKEKEKLKENEIKNKNNILKTGKIKNNTEKEKALENSYNPYLYDANEYACVDSSTDESWLNEDSLSLLLWSLDWNSKDWFRVNYTTSWHLKLPKTNKIEIPDLNSSNQYVNITPYNAVSDNWSWECNQFFCIVINFVVNNHKLLWYSQDKSVQNILEVSNKHLKKLANTSAVQWKMWTNNFEMTLRDLNLPDMFHMWFIVSKKSPPILNLDNATWKSSTNKEKENADIVENIIREKYKNLGLNYDKPNNINNFKYKEKELLTIIHSLENPSRRAENLRNEYQNIITLKQKAIWFNKNNIDNEINNDILKEFNTEFTELEQFSKNIIEYTNSIDILIKKIKEIPTYSW